VGGGWGGGGGGGGGGVDGLPKTAKWKPQKEIGKHNDVS